MPVSHRFQWEIASHSNVFEQSGAYVFVENQIETALKMYIGPNKKAPQSSVKRNSRKNKLFF